jgi:hypothetical protein
MSGTIAVGAAGCFLDEEPELEFSGPPGDGDSYGDGDYYADGDADGDADESYEINLGADDCSGAEALGTWQRTSYDGKEVALIQSGDERVTFRSDCSVIREQVDGSPVIRTDHGYFRQYGLSLELDFPDASDMLGELDGDSLYLETKSVYYNYVRTSEGPYEGASDCTGSALTLDRVTTAIVPPAGVQVKFRVLDCQGNAVRELKPEDVRIINDEKGEAFGVGGEGGSVSDLAAPSNFTLMTVLALDMSDSIKNADAVDDVIDGAKRFVELLVTAPEDRLKHHVALIAFGRPEAVELVQDFTNSDVQLNAVLEDLRTQPSRGTTDLYGAYLKSLRVLSGSESNNYYGVIEGAELVEKFLVLLTDGTHEAGDEYNLRSQALSEKEYSDVGAIYSIGIQGNFDQSKLIELASSDNNYVEATNASDLSSTFEDLAERVAQVARSNYVVGVCTPVALGSPSLTIEVSVDGMSGSSTVSYTVSELNGDISMCDPAQVASYDASSGLGQGCGPYGDID